MIFPIRAFILSLLVSLSSSVVLSQEHSIAREWNELILHSIRNDFARPTMHARNLFHTSAAMYDCWAIFDPTADTYIIGRRHADFESDFDYSALPALEQNKDLDKTISYAVYRVFIQRYQNAPKYSIAKARVDQFMINRGYDLNYVEADYSDGDPASLGNFIGLEVIKYGLTDGANEQNDYANEYYQPVNNPLDPTSSQPNEDIDPNRWQPLFFGRFIDQSGNPLAEAVPQFLSPEWGNVEPFALIETDREDYDVDGDTNKVYLDPGPPPFLGDGDGAYQWGFSLVSEWSSHMDHTDTTLLDISPASIGNIDSLPTTLAEYQSFYKPTGGDWGQGHTSNPSTGQPYEQQIVTRGDYARVLAEFWADGPDSETPPGHWFSILNYVTDHPDFQRKYAGTLDMSALEYDVKAYFLLGGAMHDAAISAWSIKGYYDYVRPISAIRYMASKGQSSDPSKVSFHPEGILLRQGYIELVEAGDIDFPDPQDIGQIKLLAWRGPSFIDEPASDVAGVDWILASDWWPYQRPSFITPPFAGYISGHSTFSRTAADVLTFLTGDPFFPGGLGEFVALQDSFLVFEDGPSTDVILQWATYRDASDQCSLSRIWGGIHPPADDIPGRIIGIEIAKKAVRQANKYFAGTSIDDADADIISIFPNPIRAGESFTIEVDGVFSELAVLNSRSESFYLRDVAGETITFEVPTLNQGIYFIVLSNESGRAATRKIIVY